MDQPTSMTPGSKADPNARPLPLTLEQYLSFNPIARAGLKALTEGAEIAAIENRWLGVGQQG